MPRMLRRIVALALGVAALLGSVQVSVAAERVTIRIGYAGPAAEGGRFVSGPVGVIASERYIERAFADDPAVTVEWSFFKGAGPAVNEALASGQLDFAFMGDLPSLTARAAGLQTRILMATSPRDNLYLVARPDSGIAAIGDVRGRRVAQFRGTSTHLTTDRALSQHGIDARDIRFFNMDDATALAAIASGDVDAAFGKSILLRLVEQGLAKVAFSTKGDPATTASNHLLVAAAFEAAHPDWVAKVVRGTLKALAWSSREENREAVFAIWAKSGTPIDVFRADYEGQALAYRLSPLIDDLLVASYRYKAAQVKALGLVRRPVDVTGWFEPKYLDAALKDLGLEKAWIRYAADGKPLGNS
ncbi:ABC transporter substrate-binding protein [Methylobacterium sp. E-066]|uniref:ABC transporter substrate-binding protein n=1 Tax=Methylobacterium sp. E-066 TaxID=2836584 RepID=UPI001FB8A3EE|nr:ABC transporter substrate-binding protein [Methylobacterium sp. E-066]MCJ2144422.1 ABC transporter substrate-binding protein [Methylobacterium sp. E-066]